MQLLRLVLMLVVAVLALAVRAGAAPVLDLPGSVVVEAQDGGGAVVLYTADATNPQGHPLSPPECTPASGSVFELGETTVACTRGETTGSFSIVVVDTVAPVLTVPADIELASAGGGVAASDPLVAGFLAAASASDLVAGSVPVNNDAPAFLPVGATLVTFTATDPSGNAAIASATIVVTAPPPPPTPPSDGGLPPEEHSTAVQDSAPASGLVVVSVAAPLQLDRTPPDNVRQLRVLAGDHRVTLDWQPPLASDLDHIVIFRSANEAGAPAKQIFSGATRQYIDRKLKNRIQYRYVVVSFDRAGNRSAGVAIIAKPEAQLLLEPATLAQLSSPPRLRWVAIPRATYYNVQLYRNGKKILSAWPTRARLQLQRRWIYQHQRLALFAGRYRWYVWPGYAKRTKSQYGRLLGTREFIITT